MGQMVSVLGQVELTLMTDFTMCQNDKEFKSLIFSQTQYDLCSFLRH